MGALGINLPGLITQVVSFTILVALLYAVLYKPVLRMLDQRASRIKDSLETAQRVRDEAARSQQEMEQRLQEARTEGQAMIAQAREAADRFRDEETRRARDEIRAERGRAEAEIQRERDAAIEELRREFADLAITAAERVVERTLNPADHRQLIERALEESSAIQRG